jgi:hypothetical protein
MGARPAVGKDSAGGDSRDVGGLVARLRRRPWEAFVLAAAFGVTTWFVNFYSRMPVAAMLGFTEMIETSDVRTPELAESLEGVRRNGQHLLRLVDDLLAIATIESGRTGRRSPHATVCHPTGRAMVGEAFQDALRIDLMPRTNSSASS